MCKRRRDSSSLAEQLDVSDRTGSRGNSRYNYRLPQRHSSGPANPDADPSSREYYGDTEAQANSVFANMAASLENLGLGFGDVIKMTVFLVGDPEMGGRMDFGGFMKAYSKHFGTEAQPNKPARSAIQIAALARPGVFIEIEVVLARP